jgi:predicted nucleic acid-binding protein
VPYLDSSALVKHYVWEPGTDSLNARVAAEERAGHSLFTSVLTFADVHHALASKLKDKSLCPVAFAQANGKF